MQPLHTKKSRIREIKHLSTDADSRTDTTIGWTKNTKKHEITEKQKKTHPKRKNSKVSRNMPKLVIHRLREVGEKICLNGTSKVNTQTHRRTDGQTDGLTDGQID